MIALWGFFSFHPSTYTCCWLCYLSCSSALWSTAKASSDASFVFHLQIFTFNFTLKKTNSSFIYICITPFYYISPQCTSKTVVFKSRLCSLVDAHQKHSGVQTVPDDMDRLFNSRCLFFPLNDLDINFNYLHFSSYAASLDGSSPSLPPSRSPSLTDGHQPLAAHYVNSPAPGCQLLMSPLGLFNLEISAGWDLGGGQGLTPSNSFMKRPIRRGRARLYSIWAAVWVFSCCWLISPRFSPPRTRDGMSV